MILETERLALTLPGPDAADRVLAYFETNRAHLAPWEPVRPPAFFTLDYWHDRLAQNWLELEAGASCRLFVFERGRVDADVIGSVNLTQVCRGAFESCMLGYSLDHRHVGRGLMTEALQAVVAHAFGPMGLHRIQANYMPENERSGATLRRLGFVREGFAPSYLRIGGEWRDHVLTALLNA